MLMKEKKNSGSFLRLFQYISAGKLTLFLIVVFLIISTVFSVLAPQVIRRVTDALQAVLSQEISFDGAGIGRLILTLAAMYLLANVFLFFANRMIAIMTQRAVYLLRQDMQHKLQRLSLNYLDSHKRGDTLACATADIVTLTTTLEQNLGTLVSQITVVIGTLIMMFTSNVQLSIIFVLLIPASILSMRLVTGATQKLFKQQQQILAEMNAHIEEMTAGHEVMKAFNYEQRAASTLDDINVDLFKSYLRSRTISGFIHPLIKILNNLVYIAVCVFGAMSIVRGSLTLGGLTAFLMYAQNIVTPISQFSVNFNLLQSGLAAAERVFELLDGEEEQKDEVKITTNPQDVQGEVSFSHVRFGYTPEKTLMHDVNFTAHAGQVFAIVGPSGAGKTTLVNLLMRFYDINGGVITVDGNPINDLSRHNLRQSFGMILQDSWVFDGTIAENIAYGKLGATRDEVIAAAKKAQCDNFIRLLADGYDTHISEATTLLSAGEKQLLCIARCIIQNPKILILDEATSSIDTRTELLITRAMAEMMKGRTSFVIAHRLFTIRNSDAILFMKNGDILEVGTHAQLMRARGHYAELYSSLSD